MKKKLFIIIPVVIAVTALLFSYYFYNKGTQNTRFTIADKKYIEESKKEAIDVAVINDYPLYGMNGTGVFFNFLKDFEKETSLEFNKIPYLKESTPNDSNSLKIRILDTNKKLSKNDLLLFSDSYIAVGKTYQRINHITDMKNITFGVFTKDATSISYYLKGGTNLSYKTYNSIDELYQALNNGEVSMIIIPNIMYLDYTIDNNYSINYYFTEIEKNIVLTLTSDNKSLNTVVRKYYIKWKNTKYVDEYNKAYLNYYLEKNKLTDKQHTNLVSKSYVYGYVENSPYEVSKHNKVVGIALEYIDRISRLTNIEFTYKKYKNLNELKKAINNKEIDLYFDYYNYSNKGYMQTLSTFIEDYVVLGKQSDDYIVNSFESLNQKDLVMVKEISLYNYFEANSKANITKCNNTSELTKKANDKLIVVDREVYNKYKNKYFKDYTLLYMDTMMNDYKFMVKNNNKDFYNLFNYVINTNSYYNYLNSGLKSINKTLLDGISFQRLYTIILLIIFIPVVIFIIIYTYLKNKKKVKKAKIVDIHKYIDVLTSLKNRNYLNDKMKEWEESKVFPQAIVITDLNNVKYVNDNYGHEEGDQLIIKAASILVNTQLENSEIMRTDGNEFLIYLVGYSDSQVSTYVKKLSKEFKNLPHEFGAGIGYSMIEDEIKTLDDAINEATLEMITNKEDFK